MKFYLAGRYSRRNELREVAAELGRMGHTVTSRWLDTDWDKTDARGRSTAAPPEYREKYAVIDLEDVAAADAVVSFTEPPDAEASRGGRHVEFGYALGLNKMLFVIGHRENLFHHLPRVQFHASVWDWMRAIERT